VIDPAPVPLVPVRISIHEALAVATQLQSGLVVTTETTPAPPALGDVCVDGSSETEHGDGGDGSVGVS